MNPCGSFYPFSRLLMCLLLLALSSITGIPTAVAQEADAHPSYTIIHADGGTLRMESGSHVLHWDWEHPSNAVLIHLDEQGGYTDQVLLASSVEMRITSSTQSADGSIYLCGVFKDTLFYSSQGVAYALPAMNKENSYDSFIARTDGRGDLDWIRPLQSVFDIQASSAIVDAEGNVYVAGHFSEYVQFEPEGPVEFAPWCDLYITSYSPQGDFRWLYRTEIDHAFPTFSVHDLRWDKNDRLTLYALHQEVDGHPMDVEMGRGETVIWNDRSAKEMELTVNAKGRFISARSDQQSGRILGHLEPMEPSSSTFGHLSFEASPDRRVPLTAPR